MRSYETPMPFPNTDWQVFRQLDISLRLNLEQPNHRFQRIPPAASRCGVAGHAHDSLPG